MAFFRGGFDDSIFNDMHRMMRNHLRDMDMFFEPFNVPAGHTDDSERYQNPRQQMIDDGGRDKHYNPRSAREPGHVIPRHDSSLGPFGFGLGDSLFGGLMRHMERLQSEALNDRDSHVFTHSTIMSMAPGENGRPKYYEATESTRKAGDVKETRRTLRDTDRGLEKMEIGHHIGDRGHVIEKRRDQTTGGRVLEQQEFIGLKENDAEQFDREWSRATQRALSGDRFLVGEDAVWEPQLAVEAPKSSRRRSRSVPRRQQHDQEVPYSGPTIVEVPDDTDHGHRRDGGGFLGRMKTLFRI